MQLAIASYILFLPLPPDGRLRKGNKWEASVLWLVAICPGRLFGSKRADAGPQEAIERGDIAYVPAVPMKFAGKSFLEEEGRRTARPFGTRWTLL